MDNVVFTNRDKALVAMQKIELEGLEEIDRICRKYGIKYSLGGGTCLGQVRHGGIIPWDDDIDVDMTVENYDRFMEVAVDELKGTHFFLRCRETDPTHLRSAARLENTETFISIPRWDGHNKKTGIFVDIFRWNYLPDDPIRRRRVASELFFIHCMQSYKEYHKFAAKLDPSKRLKLRLMSKVVPEKVIEKRENKLIHLCKEKTGWIIDDAIIHGDHGGYPSYGIDEYEDVEFEGLKVMSKKNCHNFLKTIYGEDYNEWLPPAKRISHHTWTAIDLGRYAEKYGVDESYKDSMTIKYSERKLRQMKIVSDDIVKAVTDICDKYDIDYHIAAISEKAKEDAFPGIDDYWTGPATILMLRKDYERFGEICQKELGKKYFYQTHETEPTFYYECARVRLNFTSIHDRKIKPSIEHTMNDGFFAEILPLDNCGEDAKKELLPEVKTLSRQLKLKWVTLSSDSFVNLKNKDKKLFMQVKDTPIEKVYQKYVETARRLEDQETEYCFDSSTKIGGMIFSKRSLAGKRYLPILNKGFRGVRDIDSLVDKVWKQYGACYLTYYDYPDYQLSILRYNEKENRLYTNEELIEFEGGYTPQAYNESDEDEQSDE